MTVTPSRAVRFFPLMTLLLLKQSCSSAFIRSYPICSPLHRQCRPPLASHPQRLLSRRHASVTGSVYQPEEDSDGAPKVTLFTKEGCTLCDKVKDVLKDLRQEVPHSLEQIDITDDEYAQWFAKYKYDIPVLHLNGQYWLKHRTNAQEALEGLKEARDGSFVAQSGEPNAEAMERK